jgi:hypothetical protein
MKHTRHTLLWSLVFALALVCAQGSSAAQRPTMIIPPALADELTGQTYGEWSATLWQYMLSFPKPANPLLDLTGASCGRRQSGHVFFLVGSFVGPVLREACRVPAGHVLFFPLVNIVDVNTGSQTAAELFAEIAPIEDGAHHLYARVDGVALKFSKDRVRAKSPAFQVRLPKDNLFDLPRGTYSPAVADGYYLMLAPLSRGPHTVAFGGTDGNGFVQDIVYEIIVEDDDND